MKSVLFDFDGTLADTQSGIVRTAQQTLRLMGMEPAPAGQIVKAIGLPLADTFRIGSGVPEERLEEAVSIYRSIFDEVATPSITLFDGVEQTLRDLARQGTVMAIASSRGMKSLTTLVQHLGIGKYMAGIFGEEHAVHPKPAPDLAIHIMQTLGLHSGETLVVGDTVFDLVMGKDAGCLTCGVSYGNQSREQLATAYPDFIIDCFTGILDII